MPAPARPLERQRAAIARSGELGVWRFLFFGFGAKASAGTGVPPLLTNSRSLRELADLAKAVATSTNYDHGMERTTGK